MNYYHLLVSSWYGGKLGYRWDVQKQQIEEFIQHTDRNTFCLSCIWYSLIIVICRTILLFLLSTRFLNLFNGYSNQSSIFNLRLCQCSTRPVDFPQGEDVCYLTSMVSCFFLIFLDSQSPNEKLFLSSL